MPIGIEYAPTEYQQAKSKTPKLNPIPRLHQVKVVIEFILLF